MMTKTEANQYLLAILTTLDEVETMQENAIYFACDCNIETFTTIKYLLVASGLATTSGLYTMSITPAGREMAAKIKDFAGKTVTA